MATKNVQANAWRILYRSGSWGNWQAAGSEYWELNFSYGDRLCERFPTTGAMRITRVKISTQVNTLNDATIRDITLNARLYRDDPSTGTPIATVSKDNYKTGSLDFDFSGFSLDVNGGNLYVGFDVDTHGSTSFLGYEVGFTFPSVATITYSDIPALTPSIVLPSGTQNGAQEIIFSWQTSGVGTQTKAELQWSTDGVSWKALTTVGTAQSYTAPAATFPAGTIYWRIRVTSSYGSVSNWVQRSFTAQYAAASVTLTTPTSGSVDGGKQIAFAWTITAGGGTVTGTVMEISTDDGLNWTRIVAKTAAVNRYDAAAGKFPPGRLLWRVRVRDSYAGWSDYKQASITIAYSAVSQVVPVNTPTSGLYNAASRRDFTVALQASDIVYAPFTVAAATLYWRAGESGEFTAVTMTPDGNQASATIPAGTFPSGIIQWYAEATDNTGRTTQTETYTLTALNATVEATPLSPINTLESGSGPVTFRWSYGSLDGGAQKKAEIRYSTDGGESWTMLPEISGDTTRAVIPAGTFSAGTITWQVRAYNEAGTEGPWSASVSFISFAAPTVTGVLGDGKPFLTISWQVDAQQAYEVEVDGKTYGPYYGENVRSFTLPEPLPDGSYIARVRAQNRYGLWSEWAEGNVDVTNENETPFSFEITSEPGNVFRLDISDPTVVFAPIIIEQPADRRGNEESAIAAGGAVQSGYVNYDVALEQVPDGNQTVFSYQWYATSPSTGQWVEMSAYTRTKFPQRAISNMSGRLIKCKVWSSSGEMYTRDALFTYGHPDGLQKKTIPGYWPAPTGYFLIYRDEQLIGKTYAGVFYDRVTSGGHTYKIVQALPGGYYRDSVPQSAEASPVKCPMIAPLEGGDFVQLRLSENSRRSVNFSHRRQVAYTQYAGATFPAAEVGENETLSASFDVAYLQTEKAEADAFEALLGRDVILKSPGGQVVIGVLEGYDFNDTRFYKAYRCSLQQMEWGDFVDESGGI